MGRSDDEPRLNRSLEYLGSDKPHIVDAEFEEISDPPKLPPSKPPASSKRGAWVMWGIIAVIALMVVAGESNPPTGETAQDQTATPLDQVTQSSSAITPAKSAEDLATGVCTDDEVLQTLTGETRTWLTSGMQQLQSDGVLQLPETGDPIATGIAHANITYSTPVATGSKNGTDGVTVGCRTTTTIRDAVMLPDGNWSPAFFTVHDVGYDVLLPDKDPEGSQVTFRPDAEKVTVTIASAEMSLRKFYETQGKSFD